MTFRFGSVCSGIDAASVAWKDLPWECAFLSEIAAFPRKVLRHHYPDVPLHGDFTTIKGNEYGAVDLLIGGTPCQSFSVAGLRKGFEDSRGNLALEFIKLVKRTAPRWFIWENVPGVLSLDGGRAFLWFLSRLGECGYGFAYRILDSQYWGIPQRRRRVFVIGYIGDWRPPATVLFERESLRGNPTQDRKKRQDIASTLTTGFGSRGVDADQIANGNYAIAKCLTARGAGGRNLDPETSNLLPCYGIQGNIIGRREENGGNGLGVRAEQSPTLTSTDRHAVLHERVRKLTPVECERLMGFPDDYTKIDKKTSDSSRYIALGNSMAVPVIRWLGERINNFERDYYGKKTNT